MPKSLSRKNNSYLCALFKTEMPSSSILQLYTQTPQVKLIRDGLASTASSRFHLKGLAGSAASVLGAVMFDSTPFSHVFILPDHTAAAYFFNDLQHFFNESELPSENRNVFFFPHSYKQAYAFETSLNANILMRSEVLNRMSSGKHHVVLVTYPDALSEKVVNKKTLHNNLLRLAKGEKVSLDFIMDMLIEFEFDRTEFVYEPGQFSIRGGIIDIFSYSNEFPYRIEFIGDSVASLRTFDPSTQLSKEIVERIEIFPDMQKIQIVEQRESLLTFMEGYSVIWAEDLLYVSEKLGMAYHKAEDAYAQLTKVVRQIPPHDLYVSDAEFMKEITSFPLIEIGAKSYFKNATKLVFKFSPQPVFNKNFELLFDELSRNSDLGYRNLILTDTAKQSERIRSILEEAKANRKTKEILQWEVLAVSIHEGFVDKENRIACYTDHQIFERYHRFNIRDGHHSKEALTLKEIYNLTPGDYVTHIDHGIGKYDGLETIDLNGKKQEALRIIYKESDLLYVSIHSLHRISKYIGKEGTAPTLNRLGTNAWNKLKEKTKSRVKDIAKELIKLYAERRLCKGFAYSPDTYMQNEFEASFMYEDTPDQLKSTSDLKKDMEAEFPMDRLICGDVGFGKTEIAVRAAFKAVADSKQVAVLVPTTILALQHFNTFTDRLHNFPCKVEYISRFKTSAEQKEILKDTESGKVDILIGTHRLISNDIRFKDLGLLIIDEEQKFGVGAKEKLKQLKLNVDTLTLTATPIPRTLQFSLMGARDMSIITTPPPNRYPVQTEIQPFGEEIIRDAIQFELSRGGQVFFVNNRVQNITEVAGFIKRLLPDAKITIGHGQMEGPQLEKVMFDFINGHFDILIATTIIESGLDLPNVNTIIINDAHTFGLSDLHQLRGRVGRSNRKAFCYLLCPPMSVLSDEARKRMKAIEEFSEIGSGFNIAMRDLDIRGAGNLLGGEQSGFIADIGFEMYHKILDEAIQELKENELKDLYPLDPEDVKVKECQIETDLEILIPSSYITNITERLRLYKELDSFETEKEIGNFINQLTDRFGPVPNQVLELMQTLRLRWMAKSVGFEKLVLRQSRLICHFISNPESGYYQSEQFTKVLEFIRTKPEGCQMKESGTKLTLTFEKVNSVKTAIERISPMV